MLCGFTEKGRIKCHTYFDDKVQLKNFEIKIEEEIKHAKNLTERNINLTNKTDKTSRSIKHFHFIGWPDHGVPEVSDVIPLFEVMNERIDSVNDGKSPTVVHCSAGIGRTGTVMSIYNLHYAFKKQIANGNSKVKFSIWNIVRKLKEQRLFSVENNAQYNFIYKFAYQLLINLLK